MCGDRVFRDGAYEFSGEGKSLTPGENAAYLQGLVSDYPIISIEDGMSEDDWDGWTALTEALGDKVQLVGDDLFVTNPERLADGIAAVPAIRYAGQGQPDRHPHRDASGGGYGPPRTDDQRDVAPLGRNRGRHIADLSVATNCGQIKTGSLARSDRLAKYNQLIRIEETLGETATYAGRSVLRG